MEACLNKDPAFVSPSCPQLVRVRGLHGWECGWALALGSRGQLRGACCMEWRVLVVCSGAQEVTGPEAPPLCQGGSSVPLKQQARGPGGRPFPWGFVATQPP